MLVSPAVFLRDERGNTEIFRLIAVRRSFADEPGRITFLEKGGYNPYTKMLGFQYPSGELDATNNRNKWRGLVDIPPSTVLWYW
jgi:hypothetical protein